MGDSKLTCLPIGGFVAWSAVTFSKLAALLMRLAMAFLFANIAFAQAEVDAGVAPSLDASCTVTAMNRTAPLQFIDGQYEFTIYDIPGSAAAQFPGDPTPTGQPFRARVVCSDGIVGETALAYPEFGSEVVYMGDIFWRQATPIPVGLSVAPDKTKLTTGDSVLLHTMGVAVGGQTADLTGRAKGTLYSSSNPLIAPVNQEGVATVVAAFTPGSAARVVMTAQNEGVAGSVQLQLGPLGQLQGQVFKADGSTPVAGAQVTVIRNQPRENLGTVVTDSGGRFEMLNVSAGSFSISVIDPATGDLGRGFGRLENQGETGQLSVRLNGQGTVNVTVVNAADQAIRNAVVSFTSLTGFRDLRTLTTDANGRVTIERAMAGPFTVSTKDRASNLVAAEAGTLVPGGVVNLVVKLQPVGAIQGRVLAVDGTTVQSGVQVRIVSSVRGIITQSVTGEDGQFRFDELPLSYGPYTLDAMVNGRLKARVPFLNLTSPGQERVQDIVFGPTAQIRGVVTNMSTGQPAAGAVVTVQSLTGERYTFSTRTDDNGNYMIDGVAVGPYALTAIAGSLSAAAGGTFNQDGEIQQTNMQLASNGIVGTVFGRDNATPVGAGVTVVLGNDKEAQLQTTQTNAQGQYAFTLTNPDTYKVTAAVGNDRGMTSVVITSIVAGEPKTVNISLLAQGVVQGTVRNPGGSVVSGATVKLTSTSIIGSTTYETTSNSQGRYSIPGVFVGQFSVFAQEATTKLAGVSSGMVTVEGQVVPADINLDATGVVHGKVIKPDGSALSGATVRLSLSARNVSIETVTDASGDYLFDAAPIGEITLLVTERSSGDTGRGNTRLVTQGEVRRVNLTLLGYGQVNATVTRESQLSPVGVDVVLNAQTIYGNSSYRARVGADGVARFAFVPTGTYVVSGDVGTGINYESGSIQGAIKHGEVHNTVLALTKQLVGSVYGVVSAGMQAIPQANQEVRLTQNGRILQTDITDAQGNYHFGKVEVGVAQRVEVWVNNKLRAVAVVNLATANQNEQRNLALMGVGTVTVEVVNNAGLPQKDITVALVNADPLYGNRRTAITDATGKAIFTEVVAGRFDIDAYNNAGTLRGEDRGEVRFENDNPTYTLTLVDSYVPMPVTLYDANGMVFDLQGDGSIARGKSDVFVGNNAADVRASRLDLVVGGVAVPFLNGDGSLGKRTQSGQLIEVDEIHQASGLHVSRRTYIPQTGYFARQLEVLENRTTAPITVGVRVSSHFAQGTVGSRVVDSTSNDSVLDVSAAGTADRWVVLDDEVDADPFEQDSPPAVAMVFDGLNGRDKAAQASVTALGTNAKVSIQWQDVTIQPGETVAYMHFVTQQTGRIPARDSAKRLEQLPPEALVGMTEQEISAIRNFAVPAAGLSQLPGLPSVEGTVVTGKVLSGDGITPVAEAVVTLKSESAYYARTYRTKTGVDGAFAFATGNLGKSGVKAIVQDDFYSYATHPKTESLTTKPLTHFAEGQVALEQDLIFNRSGVLKGKVKRDNGAFLTEGTVTIPYLFPSGKKDLKTTVDAEGAYAFVAINPDEYIVSAEVKHPQGKPNVGSTNSTVTVMPAATTVADVSIEPVGELVGTLLGPDQNPVVGASIVLDPDPDGWRPPYRATKTDTAGFYRFTDVSTGEHLIVASAAAGSDRANVQASKDTITRQDFSLGIRFTRLQVQVKYARGNPAIGASVTAGSKSGVTDGAGMVTLDVPAGETIQVSARHPDNSKLTTAQPYVVLNDQPNQALEMSLPGTGLIKGVLYQSDGVTPVPFVSVNVRPDRGSQFATNVSTSSTGAFQFVGVPLGSIVVSAVDRINFKMALADVVLANDGQEMVVKLVYQDNRVALPYTMYDANAFDYEIQKSAALSFVSGLKVAPALSVNGEMFTGADVGFLDAGARQVTVAQEASLSGLTVSRKIYVPKEAYFARHLEVFENPTDSPISVSVKLSVPNPRTVVQTSSGDNVVSSVQGDPDHWLVLDDGRNEDPFVHVNDFRDDKGFAATAWVTGHTQGAAEQQPMLTYATNLAAAEWTQITVPARSKKSLLYFVAPQANQAGAIAAAERLSQLPPEALQDLSAEDIQTTANFALPVDGQSSVTPLPNLLGQVSGRMMESDLTNTVSKARVVIQSSHPLFSRTYTGCLRANNGELYSNIAGQYALSGGALGSAQSIALPVGSSVNIGATDEISCPMPWFEDVRYWSPKWGHTVTGVLAPTQTVQYPLQGGVSQDIVFPTVILNGTVVGSTDFGVSSGSVINTTVPRALYQGQVAVNIRSDGTYLFPGIPEGNIPFSLAVNHPQGSKLGGNRVAPVVLGRVLVADMDIESVGSIEGVVLTFNGEAEVGARVEIRNADGSFSRATVTDSLGRYRLSAVPVGSYTFLATDDQTNAITSSTVSVVREQTTTQNVRLIGVGVVKLTVKNANGTPAKDLTVYLQSDPIAAGFKGVGRTDFEGKIEVLVPQATYTLRAMHPLESAGAGVWSKVTSTITAHNEIQERQIVLPAHANVRITVKDGVTGLPISGAKITKTLACCTIATTNAQGQYTFANLTEGPYQYYVQALDGKTWTVRGAVTVALDGQTIEHALTNTGVVETLGKITYGSERHLYSVPAQSGDVLSVKISGAQVDDMAAMWLTRLAVYDAGKTKVAAGYGYGPSNNYTQGNDLADLRAIQVPATGNMTLAVRPYYSYDDYYDDYDIGGYRLTVFKNGEPIDVLPYQDGGTVHGRVTDSYGAPIADMVVSIVSSNEPVLNNRTKTDASGSYSFDGVPIGAYSISLLPDEVNPAVKSVQGELMAVGDVNEHLLELPNKAAFKVRVNYKGLKLPYSIPVSVRDALGERTVGSGYFANGAQVTNELSVTAYGANVKMIARHPSDETITATLDVGSSTLQGGGVAEIEFTPPAIAVRLVNAAGNPVTEGVDLQYRLSTDPENSWRYVSPTDYSNPAEFALEPVQPNQTYLLQSTRWTNTPEGPVITSIAVNSTAGVVRAPDMVVPESARVAVSVMSRYGYLASRYSVDLEYRRAASINPAWSVLSYSNYYWADNRAVYDIGPLVAGEHEFRVFDRELGVYAPTVRVNLTAGINTLTDLTMPPVGALSGVIRDSVGGGVETYQTVTARFVNDRAEPNNYTYQYAYTDGDGVYRFDTLPIGRAIEISSYIDGFADKEVNLPPVTLLVPGETVAVTDLAPTDPVGSVVATFSQVNGALLPGFCEVTVTVLASSRSKTLLQECGSSIVFTGVTPGEVSIAAEWLGENIAVEAAALDQRNSVNNGLIHTWTTRNVVVTPGQAVQVDFTLAPTLAGTVKWPDGQAAENADVFVYAVSETGEAADVPTETMVSNQQGEFRVFGLSPGTWRVRIQDPVTGQPVEQDIAVIDMETTLNVDIALKPTATIAGKVFDEAGQPIAQALVTLQSQTASGFVQEVLTGIDGSFAFTRIPLGVAYLGFEDRMPPDAYGYEAVNRSYMTKVDVLVNQSGQTLTVDLHYPMGGAVEGQVVDINGAPVSNTWVILMAPVATNIPGGTALKVMKEAVTDSEGRYRFAAVSVGKFELSAELDDSSAAGVARGEITEAMQTVQANIQLGTHTHLYSLTLQNSASGYTYSFSEGGRAFIDTPSYSQNPLAWPSWVLSVNSAQFNPGYAQPVAGSNQREWLVGPVDQGGLDVSRRIYVPDNYGFIRYMDSIKNTGTTERVVDVGVELGYAAYSSQLTLDPLQYTNSLLLVNPGSWLVESTPPVSLGVVWGANGSLIKPGALLVPRGSGQNLIGWTWQSVRLMPGETASFLSYGLPGGDHAADLIGDTLSIYDGTHPLMFEGIGLEQKSQIRNFMVQ
jgi:sarcosine oxidase gamma subunit